MQIDRKIAAIIRWLERLKKSYSSGSLETALMDAECARADIEDLTHEVWSRVSPHARQSSPIFLKAAQILTLSVSVIAVWVSPLSRESIPEVPAPLPPAPEVRPAEPQAVIPVPAPEPKRPPRRRQTSPPAPKPQAPKPALTAPVPPKPTKTVAEDEIYSLIQTGRRALKNDKTVIKIH